MTNNDEMALKLKTAAEKATPGHFIQAQWLAGEYE